MTKGKALLEINILTATDQKKNNIWPTFHIFEMLYLVFAIKDICLRLYMVLN